jgi:predicted PurR-regulated permease PerM
MKSKINKVDFQTWSSWNLPYYTRVLKTYPNHDLKKYHQKKDNSIMTLALIVVGLISLIVLLHLDTIMVFVRKLSSWLQENEDSQTIEKLDSGTDLT